MPQNDLQGYLKSLPVDDNTRADAWDSVQSSANQNDFQQRVGKLNIPDTAKADLWDYKYNSKPLSSYQQAAIAAPKDNPTPQANPSTQPKSLVDRVMGWAQAPINIGHFQENIANAEAQSNYNQTAATAQHDKDHPVEAAYNTLKRGIAGFSGDAAKMLGTPLGLGMTAASAIPGEGVVGAVARAGLTAAGLGFGVQGAHDAYQNRDTNSMIKGLLNPNASEGAHEVMHASPDEARQALGDAAGIAGGVAGGLETPHAVGGLKDAFGNKPVTPPTPPGGPASSARAVSPELRKAQAVGNPTASAATKTVYVDPDFAQHLDTWNKSGLPGARVKLQTTKSGVTSMKLAHQAPDVPGFQYTNPPEGVSAAVSETGAEGQVPVTLNATSGNRGTRASGQYLGVQVGEPTPVTAPTAPAAVAPEVAPVAPIETPVAPTPTPVVPTPSATVSAPEFAPQSSAVVEPANPATGAQEVSLPTQNPEPISTPEASSGGVGPGVSNPLPDDLAKAAPRYGYGKKNFNLNFEDPADLAAYTYAQDKTNKAQGRFEDYLLKEFPGSDPATLRNYGNTVKDTIKASAQSANVEDGPLNIPSHRNLVDATGRPESSQPRVEPPTQGLEDTLGGKTTPKEAPVEEAPKPSAPSQTDLSPLEDKIRPLVGQVMHMKRLQVGELASHAIDTAIENSTNPYGEIPEEIVPKLERLLKEPVGSKLTDDQVEKLQQLRGATVTDEPKIQYFSKEKAETIRAGEALGGGRYADQFEKRLSDSQDRMLKALQDPDTSPETKAKIQEAMEPDSKGNMKYALYEPDTQFPRPTDIDPNHIEAPFTSKQLGHEITPISVDNYKAVFGKQPRDLLLSTSKRQPYVTDEEAAQLKQLKSDASTSTSLAESPGYNPSTLINEIVGNPETGSKGSVFQTEKATGKGSEYETFKRQLYQKVLARKLAATAEELRKHVADWNEKRQGNPTALTEQLEKLPPSTRKLLPQELFNEAQSAGAETGNAPETTQPEKPVETSATPAATATSIGTGSGEETPVDGDGLRTNKFEKAIGEKFPNSLENAETLRDHIVSKNLNPKTSQFVYDRTMKTYHDWLDAGHPEALKKAYDMANAPLKKTNLTTLNMSLGGIEQIPKAVVDLAEMLRHKDVYTPEQLHDMNYESSTIQLNRWEKMSESELLKKKEGLWKNSLTHRVDGAAPTSTDPEIAALQQEHYNELVDRLNSLKEQVGPSTNLVNSLSDMFTNFANNLKLKSEANQAMRETLGVNYRNNAILRQNLDSFDRLVNNLPIPEQDRFFDSMNRGDSQVANVFKDAIDPKTLEQWMKANGPLPHPDEVAQAVRDSLDGARNRLTDASGKLDEFFVNYMPGMYDNVAAAKNFAQSWTSHRPLAGDSGFLKQRMYEFHSDALKAGLTPVTSNPVRASMMRIEQLNRFTMAHEFKNRIVGQGLADWFANGETPPVGHEALNDSLFGQRGIGQFYAPQAVARTFNNFVSAGLTGGWKVPFTNFSLYDSLLHSNSLANQMQLGLSAFHATETMLNSGFSTMATGFRQIANEGKFVKGTLNVAKGATFVMPLVEDAWNGARGLVNFRDPNKNLAYGEFNHDLEMANANVQTKGGFHLEEIDKLKQNWSTAMDDTQKNSTRAWALTNAASNVMRATVEATSWPLMNKLIPSVKAGAFYRMADQIHSQMADQPVDHVNLELQKAWDSIDNRFGQVNYDNMFLSKTMRDASKLLVRSPGWNIGTFREVGGGMFDAGKSVVNVAQGKGFQISNRTAYSAAMVLGTVWLNNIYQYMKTGTLPEGVENFFPWDGTKTTQGEKNHMYPKTYVYDAINFQHAPLSTVEHKSAPLISTIGDLIQNKDYYGREIRDPGNDIGQNAAATLGYMAHQFLPFSVSNYQESKLRNQKSGWESYAGVLPAPRWATRTNAENLANQYYEETRGAGGKSDWEMEHQKTLVDFRNKFQAGELKQSEVAQAIKDGKLSPKSVKYITTPQTKTNLENWTSRITDPTKAWNVWQAGNDQEKKLLFPLIAKRVSTQFTGEEQQDKFKEMTAFLNKKR